MTTETQMPGLLSDEWLVSYAAGALTEAQALVVATHVGYHPALQARLAEAEDIGGALLDESAPAPVDEGAFEALMARIDAAPAPAAPQPLPAGDEDLPAPLRRYLGQPLDSLKWRTMGPGMKQHKLANGPDGERLWLLRARGGTSMPVHDHRGTEFTLILRGSYRVGDQHFTPGLMEVAGPEVKNHQPMIDEGEDCICLVVTDAPIRLHSLIGRMVQPFIGL